MKISGQYGARRLCRGECGAHRTQPASTLTLIPTPSCSGPSSASRCGDSGASAVAIMRCRPREKNQGVARTTCTKQVNTAAEPLKGTPLQPDERCSRTRRGAATGTVCRLFLLRSVASLVCCNSWLARGGLVRVSGGARCLQSGCQPRQSSVTSPGGREQHALKLYSFVLFLSGTATKPMCSGPPASSGMHIRRCDFTCCTGGRGKARVRGAAASAKAKLAASYCDTRSLLRRRGAAQPASSCGRAVHATMAVTR